MKTNLYASLVLCTCIAVSSACSGQAGNDYVSKVDPYIGSGGHGGNPQRPLTGLGRRKER